MSKFPLPPFARELEDALDRVHENVRPAAVGPDMIHATRAKYPPTAIDELIGSRARRVRGLLHRVAPRAYPR